MTEHVVGEARDLEDGERLVVQVQGREIAVFNIDGEYRAYTNWCAHQGGPACEGRLTGTWEESFDREELESTLEWCREDEVLNCPWHGWEYDVLTGDCLSRKPVKLPSHEVRVEDGELVLSL